MQKPAILDYSMLTCLLTYLLIYGVFQLHKQLVDTVFYVDFSSYRCSINSKNDKI